MVEPGPHARAVDPLAPVSVTAACGTLTDVQMVNDAGKHIDAVMTADHTAWHPVVPLGYGRTYTFTVPGTGRKPVAQVGSFSTLMPRSQTKVYLKTPADAALQDGGTYGVGTVIVAQFDEQIKDRAAAERQLVVNTSPPVAGSWYWLDDQNAHWRPEHYYTAGTAITVNANLYGAQLAGFSGRKMNTSRPGSVSRRWPSPMMRPKRSASIKTVTWCAPWRLPWGRAAPNR
ncbi:MAG: hypothetical protein JWR32_1472 [Mycobacterium sp.]|jgi:hypothetical protein|nr:hypothetical protein [Mycobacterium sp.]